MTIVVRQAGVKDLDTLAAWRAEVLREVFSLPQEQDISELEKANRDYYADALPTDAHIACFAYCDGEAAGCGGVCLYRELPSPDNRSGMCAYLMNIYVRPAYRKRGIGEKIVGWLVKQAQNKGITKIYLETTENGKSLYRKTGFVAMQNYMKWEKNE